MENNKIERIEYNGCTYYIYNGRFVDELFVMLSDAETIPFANYYFGKIDYKSLETEDLIEYIGSTKINKAYNLSYEAALYALSLDILPEDIRKILPILTSICREMGKSELAISYANEYLKKSELYNSVALLTSLAAAYCDIGDFDKALKICNLAYFKQGGAKGYKNELSLVYARIKKALGNK